MSPCPSRTVTDLNRQCSSRLVNETIEPSPRASHSAPEALNTEVRGHRFESCIAHYAAKQVRALRCMDAKRVFSHPQGKCLASVCELKRAGAASYSALLLTSLESPGQSPRRSPASNACSPPQWSDQGRQPQHNRDVP